MPFSLILDGKEMKVDPIAERMPGGGWRCRCNARIDGLHDIFQHIRFEHGGEPVLDPRGDVYNARDLSLDDLRAGGLL